MLGGIAPKANKLERPKELLKELAEEHDMTPSSETFELAKEENISKRTMENAMKELGIVAKKIGNRKMVGRIRFCLCKQCSMI